MISSKDLKAKVKQLYVQSDELAWLGEHCNRESDDAEILIKDKRAQVLKIRDQIISGEITDFTDLVADYDKRDVVVKEYAQKKEEEK